MSKSELNVISRVKDQSFRGKYLLTRLINRVSESVWLCKVFSYNEEELIFEEITKLEIIDLGGSLDVVENDFVSIIHGRVRVVYSSKFVSNTVFTTVRCNSNCIMCSQPPLENDDGDFNLAMWHTINDSLAPNEVLTLGFSGGEPTILGEGLVKLLNEITSKHDRIRVDILSNGRRLGQSEGKVLLSKITHPKRVQFCIPVYSGVSFRHDYVVQAKASFWDTVNGLYNCNYYGLTTEVRLVIQKDTVNELGHFVEFVRKNLWFVDHFALMGLEQIGYAKARFSEIDVTKGLKSNLIFQNALRELVHAGLNVSIYNLPLCYLPLEARDIARQSISEWKNSYHVDCDTCSKKDNCSGFFSWNLNPETIVFPFS